MNGTWPSTSRPSRTSVAETCGCYGEHIEKTGAVCLGLEEVLKQNAASVPVILDFIIDPWDFPDGFKEFHTEIWVERSC